MSLCMHTYKQIKVGSCACFKNFLDWTLEAEHCHKSSFLEKSVIVFKGDI